MVHLDNGRVVSEDVTTINCVLDSIELDDVPYSIIINNIGPRQYAALMARGYEFEKVSNLINSGKYATSYFCLIQSFRELKETDNGLVWLPDDVVNFIENTAPRITIVQHAVKSIDTRGCEQQVETLRAEIEKLREQDAVL